MNIELETIVALTTILSLIVLVYKGTVRKDIGILGPILPRVYLLGVIILNGTFGNLDSTFFHVGIVLVLVLDFISSLFIIRGRRFLYETFNAELIETLQDLKVKYDFIVDNVPVGVYVTNITGRFEWVNDMICTITEYSREELLDMSVFDIISIDKHEQMRTNLIERISGKKPNADYNLEIIAKSGKTKRVRIFARRSQNGHNTITGSVYPLGG